MKFLGIFEYGVLWIISITTISLEFDLVHGEKSIDDKDSHIVESSVNTAKQFPGFPGFPSLFPGGGGGGGGIFGQRPGLEWFPGSIQNPGCRTRAGDEGTCVTLRQCYPFLYSSEDPNDLIQLRNPTLAEFYIGASTSCNNTVMKNSFYVYADGGMLNRGFPSADLSFGNINKVCCPNQIKRPPSAVTKPPMIVKLPTKKPDSSLKMTVKPEVKPSPPRRPQQPILGGPNGPRPPVNHKHKNPQFNVTTTTTTATPIIQSTCGNARVVGGTQARPGSYPWIVSIVHGQRHICGGSLIDSVTVLTAAHCFLPFTSRDLPQLKVLLGDHDLSTTSEALHTAKSVKTLVKHRGFSQHLLKNDIALLKLDSPVHFSATISPICLTTGENMLRDGTELTLAGWGGVKYPSPTEKILRHVTLPLWSNDACAKKYGHLAPGGVTGTQICAGATNRDACQGDSGGPLMYRNSFGKYEQIGIVSWGIGCGTYPGVYTRVSSFLSWIEKNRNP